MPEFRFAAVFLGVLGLSLPATAQDTYSGGVSFIDYSGVATTHYGDASSSSFSFTNGASRGEITNRPFAAASASIAAGSAGARNGVYTSLSYGLYVDGAQPDEWIPVRYRGRFEFGASGNDDPVAGGNVLAWLGNANIGFSIYSETSVAISASWNGTRQGAPAQAFNQSSTELQVAGDNTSSPNSVNGLTVLSNGLALGYSVAGGLSFYDGSGAFGQNFDSALDTLTGEFSGLTYLHADQFTGSAYAGISMNASASFCLIVPSVGCTESSYEYSGALPDGQFINVRSMIDPEFWVDPDYLATNEFLRLRVSDGVANALPVPEQSTWALMILGLAGIGYRLRRSTVALADASAV